MQINSNEIEKKLAADFNLPVKIVRAIPQSICNLVKQAIKEGEGKSVRLKYFGIFVPKDQVFKRKNNNNGK